MTGLPGSIRQSGGDVLRVQKAVIRWNLLPGRPCGDQFQKIAEPDPITSNTRPATTLARLNGNSIQQIHTFELQAFIQRFNGEFPSQMASRRRTWADRP